MTRNEWFCWRSRCGRYTVEVSADCIKRISELAKEALPHEIGSALVGSYTDDGFLARIEEPGPIAKDSKGSRMAFHRGVQGVGKFFAKVFQKSSGRRHYVGEWHSHPGGGVCPSGTDDMALTAICQDPRVGCPETVLVLLGGSVANNPKIGVFVYSRSQGRMTLGQLVNANK